MDRQSWTCKNGKEIWLEIGCCSVTVYDEFNRKIGCIEFEEIEAEIANFSIFLLSQADVLPIWQRQGIATEAVRFGMDRLGIDRVCFPPSTGSLREQGNILTIEGAALANRLVYLGLGVAPHSEEL